MKKCLNVLAATAVLSLLTTNAQSTEWDFYGSVRMQIFNYDVSDDRQDFLDALGEEDPYSDFVFDLDKYTTRLGAWVSEGDFKGVVEIRPDSDDPMRLWYGTWDFGAGELLIGQSWTPLNMYYSSQAAENENNLLDYGALWELRHPMIQIKFKGLTVALVEPGEETTSLYSRQSWVMENGRTETKIPKIEAKYSHELGPVVFDLYGGYNTYDLEFSTNSVSIDSYVYGGGLTLTFGGFKMSGAAYYAQNASAMGLSQVVNYSDPEIDSDGSLIDNESLGWLIVMSYTVNDWLRFEAGYSSLVTELDDDATWSQEDDTAAYYLQAKINVNEKIFIVPEVGQVDYDESYTGTETGDKTYFGLKVQYDF